MKKIWIIAVIAAVFMFACGYSFLSSQGAKISGVSKEQKLVNVVVAIKEIAPFTTLSSDMLTVKQTVANAFLTDYYTSVNDLVGCTSTSKIFSGEVLNSSRVTKDKNAVGLSAELEMGKRAISISVDTAQGVANNLKVGNYVDVVFAAALETEDVNGQKGTAGMALTSIYGPGQPANTQVVGENIGQYYSAIALQNIKVVALNNSISDVATEEGPVYTSVTLEVTPAEAAKIALLNNNGSKIQLILRPMEDDSTVNDNRDTLLKVTG